MIRIVDFTTRFLYRCPNSFIYDISYHNDSILSTKDFKEDPVLIWGVIEIIVYKGSGI